MARRHVGIEDDHGGRGSPLPVVTQHSNSLTQTEDVLDHADVLELPDDLAPCGNPKDVEPRCDQQVIIPCTDPRDLVVKFRYQPLLPLTDVQNEQATVEASHHHARADGHQSGRSRG